MGKFGGAIGVIALRIDEIEAADRAFVIGELHRLPYALDPADDVGFAALYQLVRAAPLFAGINHFGAAILLVLLNCELGEVRVGNGFANLAFV